MSQLILLFIFIQTFLVYKVNAKEYYRITSNDEYEILDGNDIQFLQNSQQRTFFYYVNSPSYIEIKVSIISDNLSGAQQMMQLCTSKNKVPSLQGIATSQSLLNVQADQCDVFNYQLSSNNYNLYYWPTSIQKGDKIYISIFMNAQLDNMVYKISITLSSTQLCPNQCSGKGSCQQSCTCLCNSGYLWDDCSFQAPQLQLNNEWVGSVSSQSVQYLLINFKDPSFQTLSSLVSVLFKVQPNQQLLRSLGASVNSNSPQIIIYYLFRSSDSNELPSALDTKQTEYLQDSTLSIDFAQEQITTLTTKTTLVLSINVSSSSAVNLSVEVASNNNSMDDTLKTKIFIFFFGGLGIFIVIWIIIMVYRTVKRRREETRRQQVVITSNIFLHILLLNLIIIEHLFLQMSQKNHWCPPSIFFLKIKQQKASEQALNRRTNRVSPSKLSLNGESINKYMPIHLYSEIIHLLKQSYKNIAVQSLLLISQKKETIQNLSIQYDKEKSDASINQFGLQYQDMGDNNLPQSRIFHENSLPNFDNIQDQENGAQTQLQNQQQEHYVSNLQDQNDHNQLINNISNFDNSIQLMRVQQLDSYCDQDDIDEDNIEEEEEGMQSKDGDEDNIQKGENIQQNENQIDTCSVCLLDFKNEDQIRITICDHIFHGDCLLQWFKSQETCPNCRKDLSRRKLRQWYQHFIREQRMIKQLQKEQVTYSTKVFSVFPQANIQSASEREARKENEANSTESATASKKRQPIFTFKKIRSIKKMNGKQNESSENSQKQMTEGNNNNNNSENMSFNGRVQEVNGDNQSEKESISQNGSEQIDNMFSFNGAMVRFKSNQQPEKQSANPDTKILNYDLNGRVIEDENEEEEGEIDEERKQNKESLHKIIVVSRHQSQHQPIDTIPLETVFENSFRLVKNENRGKEQDNLSMINSVQHIDTPTPVGRQHKETTPSKEILSLGNKTPTTQQKDSTKEQNHDDLKNEDQNNCKDSIDKTQIGHKEDKTPQNKEGGYSSTSHRHPSPISLIKNQVRVQENKDIQNAGNSVFENKVNDKQTPLPEEDKNRKQNQDNERTLTVQRDQLMMELSLNATKNLFQQSEIKQQKQSNVYNNHMSPGIEQFSLSQFTDNLLDTKIDNLLNEKSDYLFNNSNEHHSKQDGNQQYSQTTNSPSKNINSSKIRSPSKLDSITQNIEMNSEFDPSVFRLKTEEVSRMMSKQSNQNKEKSQTVMRNNKKVENHKISLQNKSTDEIDKQLIAQKLNSRYQCITPDNTKLQISYTPVTAPSNQRNKLTSSPLLIQNASNILNSKITQSDLFQQKVSQGGKTNYQDNSQNVMTLSKLSDNQDSKIKPQQKSYNCKPLNLDGNSSSNKNNDLTPTRKKIQFQEKKSMNLQSTHTPNNATTQHNSSSSKVQKKN